MDASTAEPPAIDFEVFGTTSAMDSVGEYPQLLEEAPVFTTAAGFRVKRMSRFVPGETNSQ